MGAFRPAASTPHTRRSARASCGGIGYAGVASRLLKNRFAEADLLELEMPIFIALQFLARCYSRRTKAALPAPGPDPNED